MITVIVLFAVLLGFIQEYRARRALDALRQMAAPVARVLRDGEETVVPARDLVPGDVVLLRAGDRVPADTRLTQAINLAVDEAALTGESAAGRRSRSTPSTIRGLPLGDRRNMTYAGTLVVYGRGQGLVVATGMSTEFGQIARMVDIGRGRPDAAAGQPRSPGRHARQGGTRSGRRWSSPSACCAACR